MLSKTCSSCSLYIAAHYVLLCGCYFYIEVFVWGFLAVLDIESSTYISNLFYSEIGTYFVASWAKICYSLASVSHSTCMCTTVPSGVFNNFHECEKTNHFQTGKLSGLLQILIFHTSHCFKKKILNIIQSDLPTSLNTYYIITTRGLNNINTGSDA